MPDRDEFDGKHTEVCENMENAKTPKRLKNLKKRLNRLECEQRSRPKTSISAGALMTLGLFFSMVVGFFVVGVLSVSELVTWSWLLFVSGVALVSVAAVVGLMFVVARVFRKL